MIDRTDDILSHDIVVVGGGLAGQLCVLALDALAPHLSVALVERADRLGGKHTWCCHRSDLALPADLALPGEDAVSLQGWFLPLADVRWPRHRVRFPKFERMLDGDYLCLRSSSLARTSQAVLARPGRALLTGRKVVGLSRHHVTLDSGERLAGRLVLDARGGDLADGHGRMGFQKFLGWEIELEHPLPAFSAMPVLMDATVAQIDGYRFIYSLPFSSTRILVEDTYFSRVRDFQPATVRERLRAYLAAKGAPLFQIVREESGILPMPWGTARHKPNDVTAVGYRGGFFHPGTGYSLARAAIVAHRIASLAHVVPPSDLSQLVGELLQELRSSWAPSDNFARLLNRLAFGFVPPTWLRDAVYAPVYRLPQPTLERFYAGRTSRRDRWALATAPARMPIFRSTTQPLPLFGEDP
jgi:lycopene beta-cyclase